MGNDVVPVVALDMTAASPAASQGGTRDPAPPMPVIDTRENADVLANMRNIVPYTIYHLRLLINSRSEFKGQFPDQEPASHQPLEIKSASATSMGTLTSYKPRWTVQAARDAVESTGMFEA